MRFFARAVGVRIYFYANGNVRTRGCREELKLRTRRIENRGCAGEEDWSRSESEQILWGEFEVLE